MLRFTANKLATLRDQYGATACVVCQAGEYSYQGSNGCVPQIGCTEGDMTFTFGPCASNGTANVHAVTYEWITPPACDTLSNHSILLRTKSELCTPRVGCGAGRYRDASGCVSCPSGTYSDGLGHDQSSCLSCPAGSSPSPGVLSTSTWNKPLPNGYTTGCTGACTTGGWRAAYHFIDSGSGQGFGSSTFLETNVDFAVDGFLQFSYSLSCTGNNRLFFSVDGVPRGSFTCSGCMSGFGGLGVRNNHTVQVRAGIHHVRWWYQRNEGGSTGGGSCDRAALFEVSAIGARLGGSSGCSVCAPGTFSSSSSCANCPAGTSSSGDTSTCIVCADGTFSVSGGTCKQCGAQTRSNAQRTDCTYDCSSLSIGGRTYDISALRGEYTTTVSNGNSSTQFYIDLCQIPTLQDECDNLPDTYLHAYACAVTTEGATVSQPFTLGEVVSFSAPSSSLGVAVSYTSWQGRALTLELVCDPLSGVGRLESVSDSLFRLRSLQACPLCSIADYSQNNLTCNPLSSAVSGYNYIQTSNPSMCHDGLPLPDPVVTMCRACTASDYTVTSSTCSPGVSDWSGSVYNWIDAVQCYAGVVLPESSVSKCRDCTSSDYVEVKYTCNPTGTSSQSGSLFYWSATAQCYSGTLPQATLTPCRECTSSDIQTGLSDCSNGVMIRSYFWNASAECNGGASLPLPVSVPCSIVDSNEVKFTNSSVFYAIIGVVVTLAVLLLVIIMLALRHKKLAVRYTQLQAQGTPMEQRDDQ